MLAARAQAIKRLKKNHPFVEEGVLLSKLMAYCSKEAHSCVEKGAMMAFVKLRILEPDEKNSLRGVTVRQVQIYHYLSKTDKNKKYNNYVSFLTDKRETTKTS